MILPIIGFALLMGVLTGALVLQRGYRPEVAFGAGIVWGLTVSAMMVLPWWIGATLWSLLFFGVLWLGIQPNQSENRLTFATYWQQVSSSTGQRMNQMRGEMAARRDAWQAQRQMDPQQPMNPYGGYPATGPYPAAGQQPGMPPMGGPSGSYPVATAQPSGAYPAMPAASPVAGPATLPAPIQTFVDTVKSQTTFSTFEPTPAAMSHATSTLLGRIQRATSPGALIAAMREVHTFWGAFHKAVGQMAASNQPILWPIVQNPIQDDDLRLITLGMTYVDEPRLLASNYLFTQSIMLHTCAINLYQNVDDNAEIIRAALADSATISADQNELLKATLWRALVGKLSSAETAQLEGLVKSNEWLVRLVSYETLVLDVIQRKAEPTPVIQGIFADPMPKVWQAVGFIMAMTQPTVYGRPILSLAGSSNPQTRTAALPLIFTLKGSLPAEVRQAVEYLAKQDPDKSVRQAASGYLPHL